MVAPLHLPSTRTAGLSRCRWRCNSDQYAGNVALEKAGLGLIKHMLSRAASARAQIKAAKTQVDLISTEKQVSSAGVLLC